MSFLSQLTRPTLLLDEQRCRQNIRAMARRAQDAGVRYRPHFKTHQSHAVAEWFKEEGVSRITVSSVRMAEYFVAAGWRDLTIAFPFNQHECGVLNTWSEDVQVQIVVQSAVVVQAIDQKLTRPVNALIKMDTGYGRAGISSDNYSALQAVIEAIRASKHLLWAGFLAHAGHSYHARGQAEILKVHQQSIAKMDALHDTFGDGLTYSVGDTPTCSVASTFGKATEIRPGNNVFYDVMQNQIGSCAVNQIAVCLGVPVVAKYEESRKIIVHGGAVHLSKDMLQDSEGDYFGCVVRLTENGWSEPLKDWRVTKLSQEHGTLICQSDEAFPLVSEGDWLGILPVHSCLTANLMKRYLTLNGNQLDHLEGTG